MEDNDKRGRGLVVGGEGSHDGGRVEVVRREVRGVGESERVGSEFLNEGGGDALEGKRYDRDIVVTRGRETRESESEGLLAF